MKLNNGKYLCPFCLSSTHCDGPHIEEGYEKNFLEYILKVKEDYIETTLQCLREFSFEKNIDLNELTNLIVEKLQKRN